MHGKNMLLRRRFWLGFVTGLFCVFLRAWFASTSSSSSSSLSHPPVSPPAVLCWLPYLFATNETEANSKVIRRIKHTYGPHCNKLILVTQNEGTSDLFLHHHYTPQNKFDLWNQVSRGWRLIGEQFGSRYDWFVKLDADSWFTPENFHHFLLEKKWNPNDRYYFGHTIFEQSRAETDPRAQVNLGAGYGVSRGLLLTLKNHLGADGDCPHYVRWGEDVKFADCLRSVFPTLLPNSTKDVHFRENFLPFELADHLFRIDKSEVKWFWKGKIPTETNSQLMCCSSRPVLWHHLKTDRAFYAMHYFTYLVSVDPR